VERPDPASNLGRKSSSSKMAALVYPSASSSNHERRWRGAGAFKLPSWAGSQQEAHARGARVALP